MTEREKTTLFGKWIRSRWNKTCAIEAKICKEQSLPFSALKEHQENALFQVKHGVFWHKISDGTGQQTPFDGFFMAREDAFVVIFWHQYRGDKRLTMIPIDNWLQEKRDSDRKSLTYERSCVVGKCLEF
jgi:hypothetical protein